MDWDLLPGNGAKNVKNGNVVSLFVTLTSRDMCQAPCVGLVTQVKNVQALSLFSGYKMRSNAEKLDPNLSCLKSACDYTFCEYVMMICTSVEEAAKRVFK